MSIPHVFGSAALCFGVKFWEGISEEELSAFSSLLAASCQDIFGFLF